MTYKYSICHVDKEAIEYRNNPISDSEVISIAKSYPWVEKLNDSDKLKLEETYYSPSLDFVCIENSISLGLTAQYDKNKNLEFSLWYNRPKKVKILFGLLGDKEKMVVDDYWCLNFNDTIKYLEYFVAGNYQKIETLFTN